MTKASALGASLLGFGGAILAYNAPGPMSWLWPLGFVVAFWLYRREQRFGKRALGFSVGALALAFLLSVRPSTPASVLTASAQEAVYTLDGEAWATLESLSVTNAVGDIEVFTADEPRAQVTYQTLERSARLPGEPSLVATEDGLELDIINPAWPPEQRRNLSADVTLYVLPTTKLELRTGRGDVHVEGVADVVLSADVGDVYMLGSDRADVRVQAGNVTLVQSTGTAQILSSAGSLRLDFTQGPTGPVSAQTGAGNVELSLPAGSDVSVTGVSDSRELSGDFGEILRPGEGRARLGQGWHEVNLSSRAGEVSLKLKGN